MKICTYMVTPSMRCTEVEGHDKMPVPTNHRSNGVWVHMTEALEYTIRILKKNGLDNSALYLLDEMEKVGLLPERRIDGPTVATVDWYREEENDLPCGPDCTFMHEHDVSPSEKAEKESVEDFNAIDEFDSPFED